MTITQTLPTETSLELETAQWVRLCQRRADLAHSSGRELLEQSVRQWPANVRLARDAAGVVLVADDYCDALDAEIGQAQARLLCWLHGEASVGEPPLDGELFESVLLECAPLATLREDQWIVPPSDECPVEITVRCNAGGVGVKAALVDLTEAQPAAREAVAEFLCRGQHALRFVRAEIDDRSAWLTAHASADRLESDLAHALRAVAVGVRLLVREAQALMRPELAQAYLMNVVSL
jgi:hypothetical protein